jgi:L-2-hydroxyglutarate oxidase LhgO
MARRFWRTGLRELMYTARRGTLVRVARHYVPALSTADVTTGFAGVRAQAVARDGELVDDFVIDRSYSALHVRNAPSPAATASLALARHIADEVEHELNG